MNAMSRNVRCLLTRLAVVTSCALYGPVALADDPQQPALLLKTNLLLIEADVDDAEVMEAEEADDEAQPDAGIPTVVRYFLFPAVEVYGLALDLVEYWFWMNSETPLDLNAPEVQAMIAQTASQFRPLMRSELEFVRLIHEDFTPDQRKKIAVAAEEAMKQAAIKIVQMALEAEEGKSTSEDNDEPRAKIRTAIVEVLRELLTEPQLELFIGELEKRTADRKRTVILGMVSVLDDHLHFDAIQRKEVQQLLTIRWKPKWEGWIGLVVDESACPPLIPDEDLVPLLNPSQSVVWTQVAKWEGEFWMDSIFRAQDREVDAWWGLENLAGDGPVNEEASDEEIVEIGKLNNAP